MGHFWQMQGLPQSRASPGLQEPAGHSPERDQPRWRADLCREPCRAGWQARCAAASAVLPARSQRGVKARGAGLRRCCLAKSLALRGKKTCLNHRSKSAILFQLNLPPNCEGAKPFEVCHVQSIINHCKSGIISTSIFRSLQIGWCQLALINPASGQLLCLLFMQHFPAEIFRQ